MSKTRVGGGPKKILYTLDTVRRIGLRNSAKALTAKNTCKACALGMGGQLGGMTNELGEFPSVCNKSVQAQSTDIQQPIPEEIFTHSISDFEDLTAKEVENLGRLNAPIHKAADSDRFELVSWDEAMAIAARRLGAGDPDRSFFYASGRSSNEAGFVFQLLSRLYGTNNVNNCSYYCHQATGVGLGSTIGTGTATVELADLIKCDFVFLIGANPASNHPRLIHQLTQVRERGGEVVVINPAKEPGLVKFAVPKSPRSMLSGGSEIASLYVQPRIGEDLALFKGIAKAIIETGATDAAFISAHTQGWDAYRKDMQSISWQEIVDRCGVAKETIETVAGLYSKSKSAVFAWGMGMTHHLNGVDNIEAIAALALLRGMIARPGAGLLPLRGHSNVQGIGTIGVKPVLASDVIKRIERAFGVELPDKSGMDTMACMQAAHRGEIDNAVIMGGNLFAANPNANWAREALSRIPFKLFLTTTLNRGHVVGCVGSESLILPVTARDEEWEPTTQESMFNFVRLSDGGIDRLDGVRPESFILADLATALLPEGMIDFQAFKRHKEVRKAIAEIVPGMAELAHIDEAKREFHIQNRLLHTPDFKTPSGKAHFKVHPFPGERSKGRSFTLSTVRSEGQFNSIIYEEKDSYRGTKTRWAVMMNAEDLSALNLEAGGTVDIVSEHGEMKGVTPYAFDVPRGDVLAYYPEANAVLGTAVDPRSRTPSFKYTRVDIRPTS
ncbi:MAG: FdhF/YdeP family oxidoreductase [Henriciella sp.]|nr:FdhF/YdeP family oxidoreductase [Henriciella sp.]